MRFERAVIGLAPFELWPDGVPVAVVVDLRSVAGLKRPGGSLKQREVRPSHPINRRLRSRFNTSRWGGRWKTSWGLAAPPLMPWRKRRKQHALARRFRRAGAGVWFRYARCGG